MNKRAFVPSDLQTAFFNEVESGSGNVNLIAVAGSGKSTTILRSLTRIPTHRKVKILSFGNRIVKDLKEKMKELETELGRGFPNVYISTFHSVGNSALMYYYKRRNINPRLEKVNGKKTKDILKSKVSEEEYFLYNKFVSDLVSFAKAGGLGIPGVDEASESNLYEIIEHHDMVLEDNNAKLDRAIHLARATLALSLKEARDNGWYDFDDMLYVPLYLNLKLWPEDEIFCDEAQDMNRLRREMIRRMMKSGTRVYFVGDPKQAIFGFTGATNDAMDIIKQEFKCKEMYLNVSYRCPKSIAAKVKAIVPYFEVYEGNIEGDIFDVNLKEMLEIVTKDDAILCRNVAPLVSLAFKLIGSGRACHVLGSEIGKGLVSLVKKMDAQDLPHLKANLERWRDAEMAMLLEKGKDDKAAAVADRAECIFVMIESIPESMKSIQGLIARIDALFQDEDNTLCLSSIHAAKGREWTNVVTYAPNRMPSPWARKPWMRTQEDHLSYVNDTRAMNYNMILQEIA